ncbi:MAG: hypothetical protein ACLQO7_04255 [Candidatus Bathyarchaeia archaeon]
MQFPRSRRALATVVTSLIILVVSVLLAGTVTYYAINVTSTQIQQESLSITMLHVWYDPTGGSGAGAAQAAFMMINTGGRDLVINKITIRGQSVGWTDVFTVVGSVTTDLGYSSELTENDAYTFISSGDTLTQGSALTQANGEITPKSGNTLIVYINNPDSITVNDIGLTVGVTVFTSQATYYSECNVQAYTATTSTGTSDIQTRDSTSAYSSINPPALMPTPTQAATPAPTSAPAGNSLISIDDGDWYTDSQWLKCPALNVVLDTTDTYADSPSWEVALSSMNSGVDHGGINISPGDTVVFSCWIQTSAATLSADSGNPQAGGRLGIDIYGVNGASYGSVTPNGISSQISDSFNTYVKFGTNVWTQVTMTFVLSSTYTANQVTNGQPVGTLFTPSFCIPWCQVWSDSQGSNEHGTAWFADPQLTITP